ncbi:hypothetical protein BMAGN_5003 [Bifidobacterium magnum]|uniref:Uncharacterized protein n=1 Tax=Bifidobacterium magnum TaxID=1692 RepID=A0A087BCI1_9BIFI|nr:hypothetical protein BMAGN_5003 [Bifidobacterium magnum]
MAPLPPNRNLQAANPPIPQNPPVAHPYLRVSHLHDPSRALPMSLRPQRTVPCTNPRTQAKTSQCPRPLRRTPRATAAPARHANLPRTVMRVQTNPKRTLPGLQALALNGAASRPLSLRFPRVHAKRVRAA